VQLRLAHTWNNARTRGMNLLPAIIAGLIDSDGIRGLGEAAPAARYEESVDSVETFLRRVDAARLSFADVPGSMSYLDALSPHDKSAKCALSVALHDGAAKRARKPVYDFLSLGFRDKHHVTSFTIGVDTPEVIRRKVLAAAPYPVLKMKVGVAEDKMNLRALREVAPVKPVRVDANEGWRTREAALSMIEWLAQDGAIQFVEQPMPASTPIEAWRWLKERSPLPLFGDESYHHAGQAELAAECFHGVNVKLVKAGGIAGAAEALRAARRQGLKTMLGCMVETSVLISAGAHLAELCDYLDLDGNLLITNDPYLGVTADKGILSFNNAPEKFGLRVQARRSTG
jgi:L-Ala-D/L-Glu epimerase